MPATAAPADFIELNKVGDCNLFEYEAEINSLPPDQESYNGKNGGGGYKCF